MSCLEFVSVWKRTALDRVRGERSRCRALMVMVIAMAPNPVLPARAQLRSDRGFSVLKFLLISIPALFVLFAVVEVAVWFYERDVVASAASDGAQYAATRGGTGGDLKADQLITTGLNHSSARQLGCVASGQTDASTGLQSTTVSCSGKVTMWLLPFDEPFAVHVGSTVVMQTP